MGNNLFLTGLTDQKKDACQRDIVEKKERGESSESLFRIYTKEDIINSLKSFYEDRTKSFD
jgi:hypothetical protein